MPGGEQSVAKRRALILYGSLSGNTETVGNAFADVCREYGFETDMVKITPSRDWNEKPVVVEDYDLVVLGSPIIAGLPYKEVSMVLGLQGTKCLSGDRRQKERAEQREKEDPNTMFMDMSSGIKGIVAPATGGSLPGSKGEFKKTVYGVAYVTYGGNGCGPSECRPALAVLTEYLRVNGIRMVGQFSCPGKEKNHSSVDILCKTFDLNNDDMQALLQAYKADPEADIFAKYTEQQLVLLKKHAGMKDEESYGRTVRMMNTNDPLECGKPGYRMWHYDGEHRPSERDLTKARIFMAEIIEDYFLTYNGDPRPPYAEYTCIS